MTIHITPPPDVHISASEYSRLRAEYEQAFMMYCGTPPDFEEWAIKRIQRQQTPTTTAPAPAAAGNDGNMTERGRKEG